MLLTAYRKVLRKLMALHLDKKKTLIKINPKHTSNSKLSITNLRKVFNHCHLLSGIL